MTYLRIYLPHMSIVSVDKTHTYSFYVQVINMYLHILIIFYEIIIRCVIYHYLYFSLLPNFLTQRRRSTKKERENNNNKIDIIWWRWFKDHLISVEILPFMSYSLFVHTSSAYPVKSAWSFRMTNTSVSQYYSKSRSSRKE